MIEAWKNCPYPPIPTEERVEQKSLAFCVSCNSLKRIDKTIHQLCSNCSHCWRWAGNECDVPNCEAKADGTIRFMKRENKLLCSACYTVWNKKSDWDWERIVEYRHAWNARIPTFENTTFSLVDNPVKYEDIGICAKCKDERPINTPKYHFCNNCTTTEQYIGEACWCCGDIGGTNTASIHYDLNESILVCGACNQAKNKYKLSSYSILKNQIKTRHKCDLCAIPIIHDGLCSTTSANIDHDHKALIVRGVLCSSCNKIEGYVKNLENPQEWVKKLGEYWENPPLDIHGIH